MPENKSSVFRVLDANLNRLREGLRVVEEYCRLVQNDKSFIQLKEIRHLLQKIYPPKLETLCLQARQADDDVGNQTFNSSEANRDDYRVVLRAGLKRSQEASRVIEEYAKIINEDDVSRKAKSLRFSLYTLEKKLLISRKDKVSSWFDGNRDYALYLVVDEAFYHGHELLTDLKMALIAGVNLLQLRQKRTGDQYFLSRALQLKTLCAEYKLPFIVNDRPDIAFLSAADGLHLGQDDLGIDAARKIVGEEMPIGCSTHSLEQALAAEAEGADYIGFGPVFKTVSKENPDPVVGIDGLRKVVRQVSIPVVAIGGINHENIVLVRDTGTAGIGVIRAILDSDDFTRATRNLLV
ncbi:MAG: thiamine phosphate synthase [Deltaproteobacteria bacterium]|nr:thiamine phosphate synthase [Deltaproteobacteria bacterium]